MSAYASESPVIPISDSYKKLNDQCHACQEISDLLEKLSRAKAGKRIEITLAIAKVISSVTHQERANSKTLYSSIYYCINAGLDVMEIDFDGETGIKLARLRHIFPKEFDNVYWRFPIDSQRRLHKRIEGVVAKKIIGPEFLLPNPRQDVE
jgi:hypothetical protein